LLDDGKKLPDYAHVEGGHAPPALHGAEPAEAIWHQDQWYVRASSLRAGLGKLVLKDNDAFIVTDPRGDLPAVLAGEFGYYHGGTRHLSGLELRLHGEPPQVLDSGMSADDGFLLVEMVNGSAWDVEVDGLTRRVPRNSIFVRREIALVEDVLVQRFVLHNFDLHPIEVELSLLVAADFADMFEVRGVERKERGRMLPPRVSPTQLVLRYRGLDRVLRTSELRVEPPAAKADRGRLDFALRLEPGQDRVLRLEVRPAASAPQRGGAEPAAAGPLSGDGRTGRTAPKIEPLPRVRTSHEGLSRVLERALRDVVLMLSRTADGLYPYAGIPWYGAPFGRDGSITALQLLPWMPDVARGVLLFQARHQARDFDDFTDREPGKIFHELRTGEMANLREIPFVPYYGSADSTPLFLILAREYVRASGDLRLLKRLWGHVLLAVEWMERHGDLDGDGLIEYRARSAVGLRNQGWKDSWDGVMHSDGSIAEPPIAMCEVQGYAWRAYLGCAELAEMRGELERAAAWRARAEALRDLVERSFWIEELGTYALALDGEKRPCKVLTSNPGHLLWSGLPRPEIGRRLAERLMGPELFSGYGLRTLSAREVRYSPLSYHNGSVWPHDNAIAAEGMRRYGHVEGTFAIFAGLVNAVESLGDPRIPELFGGFERHDNGKVTPYPVACSPQAWASGAMLHLVRTLLGISIDARRRRVWFERPLLPPWLEWIEVRDLPAPGGTLDFLAARSHLCCSIEILAKPPDLQILVSS